MFARAPVPAARAMTVLAVTWLLVAPGCEQNEVEVLGGNQGAYGRGELLATVDRFARSERSPERFRELHAAIDGLRPRFDEVVRKEAERHLVVLALSPLTAVAERSPDEQMRALGTTVWPSALGVPVLAGESAEAYAERVCAGPLALECKYVVPEYRPLVLGAVVWERLRERARDAVQDCEICRGDPAYQRALETYERHHRAISDQVADADERARPSHWPMAGDRASPWSGAVLFEVRKSGRHVLGGQPLDAGELAEALRRVRLGDQRLGLFIRASAPVSELRAALREARLAGFDQVALQVRSSTYPFALAAYSLGTTDKGREIPVRDIDTVQILVQALDVAAGAGDALPHI